jgi:uncharacterized membrane protein required for colicin V production
VSQSIRLDQITIAVVVVFLFGLVGYQRGVLRELVAAPAILIAPFLGPWLGAVLKPWVNRFYKLLMFARYGGLATDDLTGVMEKVRNVQPLVNTPEDVVRLGSVLFLLIIAAGYLIGEWKVKGPADRWARLLGAAMGAINGYVLIQVLLPRFWTAQFAVIVVPTASVLQMFHGQVAAVLVVAFAVLTLYALRLARRK